MSDPKTAYVLLWFPLASETFVFSEVRQLLALRFPLEVHCLYGERTRGCTQAMRNLGVPLYRMGVKALWSILGAFGREFLRRPGFVWGLMRESLWRRSRSWESAGENTWSFFAAFRLAALLQEHAVQLIVAPWANGPGTAAWMASRLTGIPFVLTGRAGDIYPEDGLLDEKIRDATLVRVNNAANRACLAARVPKGEESKVRLVYNGLTFEHRPVLAQAAMAQPYRLLAVGRLVRTKGFDVLLEALNILRNARFPFRLMLVGDGRRKLWLKFLRRKLGLQDVVEMPGFLSHEALQACLLQQDMLIVPSLVDKSGDRDGIPNVIMEALSHRLPVVATDVAGIGEVVRHGATGLLVPQRDAPALAAAIRHMAQHREEALRMAEEGRQLVEKMFDIEKNTQALRDLYCQAWQCGTASCSGGSAI